MTIEDIVKLFKKADVLNYIEVGYGIFHCEGDEAVLEDVLKLIKRKLTVYIAGIFGEMGSKEADEFCIRRLLPDKLEN